MSVPKSPQRTAILCLLIAAIAALAAYRIQPIIADSNDAPASGIGADYRAAVYGPNILVSEGQNPWEENASVPRFGPWPTAPIWPAMYTAAPLVARVDYAAGLTVFLLCSILLVAVGCGRIGRSLGLPRLFAVLVAALVVLSPVHLYNVALGQTGAGAVAAVAFFAARARQNPAWWHHLEKWIYGATILFLFAKPTFALTFLAANFAYERSARTFGRFLAIAFSIGLVTFVSILARADVGIREILRSMSASSSTLSDLAGNHMDGDRLDFLALVLPSPIFDIVALVAVSAGLFWLNRVAHTTLHERLVLSIGLVTIGSYHHVYDSLPLLALLCVSLLFWRLRRALLLGAGLVVSGWLYGLNAVREAIGEVVSIDYYALSSRIIFFLVAIVMAVTYGDIKRRARTPGNAEVGWIDIGSPLGREPSES